MPKIKILIVSNRGLFFEIKYQKEGIIFKKLFAGIVPKTNFDHLKFPDKNTIKKYIKDGQYGSSTLRGSSQRKFKRKYTNDGFNSKKNLIDLAGLRIQIISQFNKNNDNFNDFSITKDSKYIYKNKPLKPLPVPLSIRTRRRMDKVKKWAKPRGMFVFFFKWIEENILFNLERIFQPDLMKILILSEQK